MTDATIPTADDRKPWVKPDVERIAAGDAESGFTTQNPEGLARS